MGKLEELKKIKSLLDQGAITIEEFNTLKNRLLSPYEDSNSLNREKETSSSKNPQRSQKAVKKTSAKKSTKKKATKEKFEAGNEFTVSLLKIGLGLSVLTGIFFGYRYNGFVAFGIVVIVGIGFSLAIPRLVAKLVLRNILMGLNVIVLFLLLIFPINVDSNTNSGNTSSSSDDRAVLHCKFCQETIYEKGGDGIVCYTHEQGGCAWVQFYGGTKYAFCSDRCCEFYRAID